MSSPATLFSVKIASPRDVAMEAHMACDVIREWNAAHALRDHKVLLPLASCAVEAGCDMLVAFLHPTPGAPMETMELEIESYLGDKKSVFIYLSEARSVLGPAAATHEDAELCKARYAGRAVIDSFKDEKEFRARFAQQLEATLQLVSVSSTQTLPQVPSSVVPDSPETAQAFAAASSDMRSAEISSKARQLLFAACDDPEAYLGRLKDGNTLKIQANGQQFVPAGDAAALAQWEAAFREILEHGYIQDAGCHGRLFQISSEGFAYLKTQGKSPVGYIAELGSV